MNKPSHSKYIAFVILLVCIVLIGASWKIRTFSPPPKAISPYANGIFTSTVPGEGSSWTYESPFPNFSIASPLKIINFPNTEDLLVLSKIGHIHRINQNTGTSEIVLDIKNKTMGKGESGSTGMALHPKFGNPNYPDKQEIYVFYATKLEPEQYESKIFLRLSKFKWNNAMATFDESSEEILIQQYDRMTWHNGGGLFFGTDGFLYFAMGDEGREEQQEISTQRLDGGFFSGLFRIDVDKNPNTSHPIRRQPLANEPPELPRYEGWDTYSQGYYIPNDNPWLSPDSSHLEEYYALGVRSPYSTSFDIETQQIWIADVGSSIAEEINKVDKRDNLQWPYMEGQTPSEVHDRPEEIIGNEKSPLFYYDRSLGSCVIGGGIYRGNKFPNFNGKYLFADYVSDKLFSLNNTQGSFVEDYDVLISGIPASIEGLPPNPNITGIHVVNDGDIYITISGESYIEESKILKLKQNDFVPDPPSKLSELGLFEDLSDLKPIEGFIPYSVNSPLWSDRAVKKRWLAVPNDGTIDTENEKIVFSKFSDWQFPEGTVFIKHFELPITTNPNGLMKKIETRFFIIGEGEIAYGLTYKWNDDGTDAFLQGGGSSQTFDILNEYGDIEFSQQWDFPGRDQCITCHNSNANHVLGVKTHQLNGMQDYDGVLMNQLDYFTENNLFSNPNELNGELPKSYSLDDESASLESKVRSYLDSNCASCHRPNGIAGVSMDLRYNIPLPLMSVVGSNTESEASDLSRKIVQPGDHTISELWIRDASIESLKMPPISKNMVDDEYIAILAEWIDELEESAGQVQNTIIYPNPTFGDVFIQMDRRLEPPFNIQLYNSSGRLVFNKNFLDHSASISTIDFSAGTYIIVIDNGTEKTVEKIILTK